MIVFFYLFLAALMVQWPDKAQNSVASSLEAGNGIADNPGESHDFIRKDYMEPRNTAPVKGFFVFLVFCSHFRGYVEMPGSLWNDGYSRMLNQFGQLMVAPFFFYSGFGLYESIAKKGAAYVKAFPRRRFLPLWLYFSFCIGLYYINGRVHGSHFRAQQVLLSLVGWNAIGNSNWFMFVTFALYLLFVLSFIKVDSIGKDVCLVLYSALSVCLVLALREVQEGYWWNTLLCLPAGMWFGRFRQQVECAAKKNYAFLLACVVVAMSGFYIVQMRHRLAYCAYAVAFTALVTVITMKINIRSGVWSFLGKHVFGIYIIQRLVFSNVIRYVHDPYLFFVISLILTVSLATLLDEGFARAKRRLL